MRSQIRSPLFVFALGTSLALLSTGCGGVPGKALASDPAGNFSQVSPDVYRGGRPDEPGIQSLVQLGVKTIIDLENDDTAIATERT